MNLNRFLPFNKQYRRRAHLSYSERFREHERRASEPGRKGGERSPTPPDVRPPNQPKAIPPPITPVQNNSTNSGSGLPPAQTNVQTYADAARLFAYQMQHHRNDATVAASHCVICHNQRSDACKRVRSHLIPMSVLSSGAQTFVNRDTAKGEEFSKRNVSFNGFCKHTPGRVSCEDALSALGETSFNPKLHKPLVDNFENAVMVNDKKVYHCTVSIAWRMLALSLQNEPWQTALVNKFLDRAVGFVRTGTTANASGHCAVGVDMFVFVAGPDDFGLWDLKQRGTEKKLDMLRVYGFPVANFDDTRHMFLAYVPMGPVCAIIVFDERKTTGGADFRPLQFGEQQMGGLIPVPPDGVFVVPPFRERKPTLAVADYLFRMAKLNSD